MSQKIVARKIIGIFIIITLFYSLYVCLAWVNSSALKKRHISAKNHKSKQVQDFLTGNLESLPISSTETYLLSGEYGEHYFLVYANDLIKEDTLLYGNEREEDFSYWSAEIYDGTVQESWFADRPILESDLHEYTASDQNEHLYFITPLFHPVKWLKEGWIDDSEMIGYYKRSNSK